MQLWSNDCLQAVKIRGYVNKREQRSGYKKSTQCPCTLKRCPCCTDPGPEWYLDCHGGKCMNCAIGCYPESPCKRLYEKEPTGYCDHCEGKLVPVGSSRANGANHDDWDSRRYHKKCWKELKLDEE